MGFRRALRGPVGNRSGGVCVLEGARRIEDGGSGRDHGLASARHAEGTEKAGGEGAVVAQGSTSDRTYRLRDDTR